MWDETQSKNAWIESPVIQTKMIIATMDCFLKIHFKNLKQRFESFKSKPRLFFKPSQVLKTGLTNSIFELHRQKIKNWIRRTELNYLSTQEVKNQFHWTVIAKRLFDKLG